MQRASQHREAQVEARVRSAVVEAKDILLSEPKEDKDEG